jgi:hypothetical protein
MEGAKSLKVILNVMRERERGMKLCQRVTTIQYKN